MENKENRDMTAANKTYAKPTIQVVSLGSAERVAYVEGPNSTLYGVYTPCDQS